jgi:hypothetical protein
MRFFLLILALTAVVAVPVTQVPEAETKKVEVAVVEQPKAVEPAKVDVAVEGPKNPAPVEQPKVVEPAKADVAVEQPKAVEPTKVETPVEATKEEAKGQALAQVMKAVADLAAPFGGEEFNLLKEVMSKGTNILAQAEEKAHQMHSNPEFQNLLQGDSLFGIKNDGTVDADVATEQLTQLMSLLTGTKMSTQEKTLVHDLIAGFSGLFAPLMTGSDPMQSDLEKLAQQFTSKFDKVQEKIVSQKDKLLEPQTLLSVMSEEDGSIDTTLLNDVTQKFMDRISSQFEKVMGTLEKFESA